MNDDYNYDDEEDDFDEFEDDEFDTFETPDEDEIIAQAILSAEEIIERDLEAIEDLPPGFHLVDPDVADAPMPDEALELLDIEASTFTEALAALRDESYGITALYLRAISDIGLEELELLRQAWPTIAPARRVAILDSIMELSEDDWAIDGTQLAAFILDDEQPAVRKMALQILSEECPPRLSRRVVELLLSDNDLDVRAAAAGALAQFVYLRSLEELPSETATPIEKALFTTLKSPPTIEIRRLALESVSYIEHPELDKHIRSAFEDGDPTLRASALRAMGNTLNTKKWGKTVIKELGNRNPLIASQAIYAAGELKSRAATDPLLRLLTHRDPMLKGLAVWALGEVGGSRSQHGLNVLAENNPDDDELLALIDDALANIELASILNLDDDD